MLKTNDKQSVHGNVTFLSGKDVTMTLVLQTLTAAVSTTAAELLTAESHQQLHKHKQQSHNTKK